MLKGVGETLTLVSFALASVFDRRNLQYCQFRSMVWYKDTSVLSTGNVQKNEPRARQATAAGLVGADVSCFIFGSQGKTSRALRLPEALLRRHTTLEKIPFSPRYWCAINRRSGVI